MAEPDGLPTAAERAVYRAVAAEGGRVLLRDVPEPDLPAVLRLISLGLLVHNAEESSVSAVNPRAAAGRIQAGLRSAGARLLERAEDVPAELEQLAGAWEAAPRRADRLGRVRHVDGKEEIRHRLLQIEADNRFERLAAQPGLRPANHLAEGAARTRAFVAQGGVMKVLYDPAVRDEPSTVAYAAEATGWGLRIRVLAEPFTRMLIYDRAVAVIPASADNGSAAFVEDPAAVAFLVGVFERDWERAERVRWRTVHQEEGEGVPVHEQVGRLLAQGLTQRTVAGRLALSERTVAGHIARLRELYDAETLFQLGWQMRGARGGSES
ncbi:LuxR family transcriptional regulator [Kitasatospora sp. NPDC059571]|uniref:LuxR family transcriptional regulator n=1 Tax=Kitasatospora sp. NPDC059571 TaxID=3346871 RepID=UPI003697A1E9